VLSLSVLYHFTCLFLHSFHSPHSFVLLTHTVFLTSARLDIPTTSPLPTPFPISTHSAHPQKHTPLSRVPSGNSSFRLTYKHARDIRRLSSRSRSTRWGVWPRRTGRSWWSTPRRIHPTRSPRRCFRPRWPRQSNLSGPCWPLSRMSLPFRPVLAGSHIGNLLQSYLSTYAW
jgi:hypothetical protein